MRILYLLLILFLVSSCGNRKEEKNAVDDPAEIVNPSEEELLGIPDLLLIEQPSKNAEITSPLKITGKARGSWYFEADFPIEIVNEEGRVLAETYATARGNWMTQEFVPFTAEVEFDIKGSEKGSIIFRRANASGLPENDRSYRLPVSFKK